MSLKVAIFGAGSIGCYLGGQLLNGGVDVTFIGRPCFQEALTENGLTLTHWARDKIHIDKARIKFETSAQGVKEADIILVTVKSQDSQEAGKTIAQYAKPGAIIISFQNGVGNVEALKKVLKNFIVLGAVVPFNVTGTGAGYFHCGTEGDLTIQDLDDTKLTTLQSAFTKSGQGCNLVSDILAVQWGKLLVNLNNGLNTLHGGPLKTGLVQADYRKALALSLEEGLKIVKASGVTPADFGKASPTKMIKMLRLPNILYKPLMDTVVKIDSMARSSMLDDLETGRPTEIDYLQGAVVDLAHTLNMKAPVNAAIMKAVKAAFAKGESPKMSGAGILGLVIWDN